MTQYTVELRTILDDPEQNIFDFTYDKIPGVDYTALEQLFKDRFYFSEIGCETVDRFKHYLKNQWQESMFIYNKKKKAYMTEINILKTFNTTGSSENEQTYYDTPINKDVRGNPSNISDVKGSTNSSGYAGQTESELIETYFQLLHDLDSEFIDQFQNLFMGVM